MGLWMNKWISWLWMDEYKFKKWTVWCLYYMYQETWLSACFKSQFPRNLSMKLRKLQKYFSFRPDMLHFPRFSVWIYVFILWRHSPSVNITLTQTQGKRSMSGLKAPCIRYNRKNVYSLDCMMHPYFSNTYSLLFMGIGTTTIYMKYVLFDIHVNTYFVLFIEAAAGLHGVGDTTI